MIYIESLLDFYRISRRLVEIGNRLLGLICVYLTQKVDWGLDLFLMSLRYSSLCYGGDSKQKNSCGLVFYGTIIIKGKCLKL